MPGIYLGPFEVKGSLISTERHQRQRPAATLIPWPSFWRCLSILWGLRNEQVRRENEDDALWEPKSYLREKNTSSLTKWKRKTKTTVLGNQAREDGCQGNSRKMGGIRQQKSLVRSPMLRTSVLQ